MLGHVVARYLEQRGCRVATVSARFQMGLEHKFLDDLLRTNPDWVVNCAGLKNADSLDRLHEVNSYLPNMCAACLPPSVGLVHASSDAVFGASIPNRRAGDLPDAEDLYGLSKRAAEAALKSDRCFIVRCSIVGPELSTNRNLLSWFLSQRTDVLGYVNHRWNGITTLEWASLCFQVIEAADRVPSAILQPGIWPPITKYDVLCLAGQVWPHCAPVQPAESCHPVLRSLVPNVESAPLDLQLTRLRRWYES